MDFQEVSSELQSISRFRTEIRNLDQVRQTRTDLAAQLKAAREDRKIHDLMKEAKDLDKQVKELTGDIR